MTTYITDRHGQRWALVPASARTCLVDSAALQMVRNALIRDAERGNAARKEMLAELDRVTLSVTSAPDFEPREPTDAELDAVMPAWVNRGFGITTEQAVADFRQAMRAAMALWSKT